MGPKISEFIEFKECGNEKDILLTVTYLYAFYRGPRLLPPFVNWITELLTVNPETTRFPFQNCKVASPSAKNNKTGECLNKS